MIYLVDANLICEPTKSQPSERACLWLDSHDADIVIDAVVLGEMWDGIVALPDGRKRRDIEGRRTLVRRTNGRSIRVTCALRVGIIRIQPLPAP